MPEQLIQETKDRMQATLDFFTKELSVLRAGRANPAMIENIQAEVYGGVRMRIKELGTITSPEPKQLLILPFDVSNTQNIAKAIEKENLGIRTTVEGKTVRIQFPDLNEERRRELINQCHSKLEVCRVSIRGVRRDQNEQIKQKKSDKELPEDDIKKLEKHVQELTDNFCKKAETAAKEKEQEISTV